MTYSNNRTVEDEINELIVPWLKDHLTGLLQDQTITADERKRVEDTIAALDTDRKDEVLNTVAYRCPKATPFLCGGMCVAVPCRTAELADTATGMGI